MLNRDEHPEKDWGLCSVPSPSGCLRATSEFLFCQREGQRHISSRSKKICTGGAKMWRYSGRMWQKTSQVKKNICVCESVTFFPEMWRVTFFCNRKKWQLWRHSPKSETGSWGKIRVRPTLIQIVVRLWFWQFSTRGRLDFLRSVHTYTEKYEPSFFTCYSTN